MFCNENCVNGYNLHTRIRRQHGSQASHAPDHGAWQHPSADQMSGRRRRLPRRIIAIRPPQMIAMHTLCHAPDSGNMPVHLTLLECGGMYRLERADLDARQQHLRDAEGLTKWA